MDDQASFEPRAVLGRGRNSRNRLLIVVPVMAFASIAWAGLSGPRSDADATAESAATTAPALPAAPVAASPLPVTRAAAPDYPTRLLGFAVHRLDDVQPAELGPDDVTAIAGWYVATATIDCPPLAAMYRAGSPLEISSGTDSWAFCDRSGVLYASRPDLEQRLPTNNLEDNRSKGAGLPVVAAELTVGIRVPPELEVIGAEATPVVVLGRFVDSNAGCGSPAVCRRVLAIDHVGWAPGID
jgi:hypothetical protein